MDITFSLSHVFHGTAGYRENAIALRILLTCLIDLNCAFLSTPGVKVKPLYTSGVRYQRGKKWLTIYDLYKLKKGDCKSLTAALVAEYRRQGIVAVPVFRFKRRKDGSLLFHILVLVPNKDGYEKKLYEDPSKRLGMGNEWQVLTI